MGNRSHRCGRDGCQRIGIATTAICHWWPARRLDRRGAPGPVPLATVVESGSQQQRTRRQGLTDVPTDDRFCGSQEAVKTTHREAGRRKAEVANLRPRPSRIHILEDEPTNERKSRFSLRRRHSSPTIQGTAVEARLVNSVGWKRDRPYRGQAASRAVFCDLDGSWIGRESEIDDRRVRA